MNQTTDALVRRPSMQVTAGRIAAVATALLLVVFLVLSVSRAAFTASTGNEGNSVSSGIVTLTDDDAGTALFTATDVGPNTEIEQCIRVDYSGEFTSGDIALFTSPAGTATDLGTLAPFLNVDIEKIDTSDVALIDNATHTCAVHDTAVAQSALPIPLNSPPEAVYSGALDGIGSDYASGTYAFDAVDSTVSFKITVSVVNDPSAAGAAAAWDFVWETQSA